MPRQTKKNYKSTKVPTVKLCSDCKSPITRKAEWCTPCETAREEFKSRRTIKDEEYRVAYLKHKKLDKRE